MKIQQLYSLTRQAIDDYQMINDGDHIAIGVSGGKDSLAMLYALSGLSKFYPQKFTLQAVTIDLGFDNLDIDTIQNVCDHLKIPYTVIHTQIAKIVFEERKESNPCSLCAKMRKGALNDAMLKSGCNKIAYAHHMDDVISTFFLSMLYEGKLQTFWPNTYLDKTGLTIIRPFIYIPEAMIKGFINKYNVPVVKSPCPADKHTKREYTNQLIRQLNLENPGVKNRIFHAITTGNIEGWPLLNGKDNIIS